MARKILWQFLLKVSCTRWCERQLGKLYICFLKIELQREGNFTTSDKLSQVNNCLALKLLRRFEFFVFDAELFIACHFYF